MGNEALDVSQYSQAKSAANAIQKRISELAEEVYGQNPSLEITLKDEGDQYVLYWDAGPMDWPIKLTGEEPIYNVTGFTERNSEIWIEPKNSCALSFGNY